MLLAGTGANAWAQAAGTPDFPNIRKTNLATIDRNNVEAWVNQQIQQMLTQRSDDSLRAQGRQFFQAITVNAKAGDATAEFRDGLAGILATSFVEAYSKAPADRRPLACVYPLMALNQLAQPTPKMIEAFTLALSEPTSGGRLLGASGLLAIRAQLNPQQWTALLPVLQKTGAAETNGPALARIYRLLALPADAPVDTVPVVMAILEGRLARIEQKKGWPLAADAEAIKWLGERLPRLSGDQLQNRATLIMARMMTHAVFAYLSKPGDDALAGLEKVVLASEAQLKEVLNRRASAEKPPSVAAAMLEGGPAQAGNALPALEKWIGTAQEPGSLNKAPFNFEVGLKIPPPAATVSAANPAG